MNDFSICGKALLPDGFTEVTVFISDTQISSIKPGLDAHADFHFDGWIAPGLIDLQVNGAYSFDFTTDGKSVVPVAQRLPATGVTAFLPTIITSPLENYQPILHDITSATKDAQGAEILGVHLEGPYLNPKRKGAHNASFLRTPNVAEIESWSGSALVRLATLAPELPGALDTIRRLRVQGVVVSAGHSDADYAQAMTGFENGVTYGTHLYNAMSSFTHREPGLVGAYLATNVPCGLIVDGVHVHPAVVNATYRAKGARGITLVTDAMAAMGMEAGRYKLADREVIVDANSARLEDGTLAGSILQMDAAIRNMIDYTGCSLADAIAMASTTPARVLGLANKGRIDQGCDADLVVLDKSLQVAMTIARGKIVYQKEK
ncbi:MAG: N-acetylglucosamine-6-phosphate deacetylase [Chloroflexi bacterium]|nr:N-acetylglucosamine-6-phosphate deacetylase [Chloroflexota bacterium]